MIMKVIGSNAVEKNIKFVDNLSMTRNWLKLIFPCKDYFSVTRLFSMERVEDYIYMRRLFFLVKIIIPCRDYLSVQRLFDGVKTCSACVSRLINRR